MKRNIKLALAELEQEMEIIQKQDLEKYKGGTGNVLRDPNGNIIFIKIKNSCYNHEAPYSTTSCGEDLYVFANDGTPIKVFDNFSDSSGGGQGWDTNCHGYAYLDGKYWLNDPSSLINGDSYEEITSSTQYQIGDKVTYYDENGNAIHSMVISSIDSSGNITVTGDAGILGIGSSGINQGYPNINSFSGKPYKVFRSKGSRILTPEEYKKFMENGYKL